MLGKNENFEDAIVAKIGIEECMKKFDPEIQKIFYDAYGEKMETIPKELLRPGYQTEEILEQLLKLRDVNSQKIILLRYGIVTGTPMTLEQVANELGITRERARQIDSTFRGRLRPHYRKKSLIDYLDE